MKRVRLTAMLLAAALSVSSVPAVGANAAQNTANAKQYQVSSTITVSEATTAKKTPKKKAQVKLGWVKKNKKWYYVTKKGNKTGWAKIDGKFYYFDSKGVMQTGWITVKGKKYFMLKSGAMKTGWLKLQKKWYYFGKNGVMKTGWLELAPNKWFYLNKNGVMHTGWLKVKGKRYYLSKDGVMFTGPHVYKIGKKYYFFEDQGNLTTKQGWQVTDQGNHFYTYKNGTVAVNQEKDGKIIGKDGIAVIKTDNEMDAKAQGYGSDTNYLVLANLSTHKLCVYKGNKGEWKRIKGEWDLTCGAPGSRTPCGQFKLVSRQGNEYGWKTFTLSSAAYVYWTNAGFMIHTILLDLWSWGDPEYAGIVDDRLGMNLSKSCIRLSVGNARWIFENIPTDTRLVVYE